MWELISGWLNQKAQNAMDSPLLGKATEQGDSLAGNIANGASNAGAGGLFKDLAAGNFASAAGNAAAMGKQNADQQLSQSQQQAAQPMAMPSSPVSPQSAGIPSFGQQQSTPYLQKLMQQYMR